MLSIRWRPPVPHLLGAVVGVPAAQLPREILAGVTLAALMIPLNIGYAQVAGLPPIVGLYAAIVPPILFALFAHSRHLVAGPDAAIAAMLAGMLGGFAPPGDPHYLQLVLATTLLCGAIMLAFWLFRLGFLANFLSRAVLIGFITGLGIEVMVGQIRTILAVSVDAEGFLRETWETLLALPRAEPWSVVVGLGTILGIRLLGRVAPRLPGALIVLAVATVLVALLDLDARGVAVLGPVAAGLPGLALPAVRLEDYVDLLPVALALCAATLAEGPLIARRYADRYQEPVDADQDFLAFAASNAASAVTGGFAVGSSASRTAAMDSVGARSQIPSVVAGVVVAVVLLWFTEALALLPSAALAGIVANAVVGLIEIGALRELWRVRRSELLVAVTAIVAVLVLGALRGVMVAFLLSLLDLLWRASRPATAVLVELPQKGAFDAPDGPPVRTTRPGLVIQRFSAPLYFANALRFAEVVETTVDEAGPGVRWLVIDASAIVDIDVSGADALAQVLDAMERRGVVVAIARASQPVQGRLQAYGLADRIGSERLFSTHREAAAAFERDQAAHRA